MRQSYVTYPSISHKTSNFDIHGAMASLGHSSWLEICPIWPTLAVALVTIDSVTGSSHSKDSLRTTPMQWSHLPNFASSVLLAPLIVFRFPTLDPHTYMSYTTTLVSPCAGSLRAHHSKTTHGSQSALLLASPPSLWREGWTLINPQFGNDPAT